MVARKGLGHYGGDMSLLTTPPPSLNPIWRSQALAKTAAMVPDDEQVEKAFADMAYGFVQNKAGKLMRPPHQLGFEIVWKNETNTRLIGIFAFRIERDLYYVPCFFSNGEITGTDLLYHTGSGTFKALTEERIDHILGERSGSELGRPVPSSVVDAIPQDFRMDRLSGPPGQQNKYASHDPEAFEHVNHMLRDMTKLATMGTRYRWLQQPDGNLFRQFLSQEPDLMRKFASLVRRDHNLADLLAHSPIPLERLIPTEQEVLDQMSKRARHEPHDLTQLLRLPETPAPLVWTSLDDQTDWTPEQLQKLANDGFVVAPERDPDLVPTPLYRDLEECWIDPTELGVYRVLRQDGEKQEAVCCPVRDLDIRFVDRDDSCAQALVPPIQSRRLVIWLPDRTVSQTEPVSRGSGSGEVGKAELMCQHERELKPDDELLLTGDQLQKGQTYVPVWPGRNQAADMFFEVQKINQEGEQVRRLTVRSGWSTGDLFLNQQVETDVAAGVLGRDCRFIRVKQKPQPESKPNEPTCPDRVEPAPGPSPLQGEALSREIAYGGRVSRARIRKDASCLPGQWRLELDNQDMTGPVPLYKIAHELRQIGVDPEHVQEFCQDARANTREAGETRLLEREFALAGLRKRASLIQYQVGSLPSRRIQQDPIHGVQVTEPQQDRLPVSMTQARPRPHRYGDQHDPSRAGGQEVRNQNGMVEQMGIGPDEIATIDPNQIKQLADQRALPRVFEHGLLGALVQQEDAVSQVDRAISPLEDAVNWLGRLYFLLVWKPKDFEQAFGKDDISTIENKLLSQFKSLDETLLLLQKRSRRYRERKAATPQLI